MSDPYPFESDDEVEITELDLESIDSFGEQRITVSELVGESESWRFGHVIVDEAQDLTPMQWRMVMRRVRGRALTVVGDLAQRSGSVASSWSELLPPELGSIDRQELTVNYRSPAEIHRLATKVLAEFAPDVVPSTAIRSAGLAPRFERVASVRVEVTPIVDSLLEAVEGQVAVIAAGPAASSLGDLFERDDERVRVLTPVEAKGLEFDAVVLVEPLDIWSGSSGPSEVYISLTRATQRLVVLHEGELPAVLRSI